MQNRNWVYRTGELAEQAWDTVIDSRLDGWQYTGLRVGTLVDGAAFNLAAADVERIIVPLSGSFRVVHGIQDIRVELKGRPSVFDGPTDVLYLGASTPATITGNGRCAVAEAPTAVVKPAVYIPASAVSIELRGSGHSSRQVHNFGTPQALDAAKLIVCEVITPAGNWSSYPAHKHDETVPGQESQLEEIYYFESAVTRGTRLATEARPFGFFTASSSATGHIDVTERVHTGDIVLVPFGYHGPAAAAPGYDLYYLNVMAGPAQKREWKISDDPAQAWVRQTWADQTMDPRLPYTLAGKGSDQ